MKADCKACKGTGYDPKDIGRACSACQGKGKQ